MAPTPNQDYQDILAALIAHEARFLVVGAHALPPNRIDILTGVSGLTFDDAWHGRTDAELEGVRVPVLGRNDLIRNKQSSGRDRDRVDIRGLEGKS